MNRWNALFIAVLLASAPAAHAAETGEQHQEAGTHAEAAEKHEAPVPHEAVEQHGESDKHAEGEKHQTAEQPETAEQHGDAGKHGDAEEHKADESAEEPPVVVKQPGPLVARLKGDIRALFSLQDAAALGNAESPAVQRALLSQLSQQAASVSDDDMSFLTLDIAALVLSGAHPALAERAAKLPDIRTKTRKLLKGAAHFMRGEATEALTEWKAIETEDFPQHIAGRLSLARAILAKEDAAETQAWLEQAIAFMPGTLVEESALRRSTLKFGDEQDVAKLWRRAERYMRRFPNSLYAADFMQELITKLVQVEAKGKTLDRGRVDRLLSRATEETRRAGYMQMSREAAAAKLVDLAEHAARQLQNHSEPGSAENRTAVLYQSIFDLGTDGWSDARARLKDVKPDGLPELEGALLAASLAIAEGLAAPPLQADANAEEAETEEPPPAKARAETALAAADKLLVEAQ